MCGWKMFGKLKTIFVTIFIVLAFFSISSVISKNQYHLDESIQKQLEDSGSVNVIVKFKDAGTGKIAESGVSLKKVERKFTTGNSFSARLDKDDIETLASQKNVEIFPINQRHLLLSESAPIINATTAWQKQNGGINLTGTGQTVCILDTGVNASHVDLQGKILAQYCYCGAEFPRRNVSCCPSGVSQEANANDENGHGTHVAGIIVSNNAIIRGIAPDTNIIMIRVFGNDGYAYDDDIAAGIEWCVNNATKFNISVISMSLGGGLYMSYCNSDTLASYIDDAVAKNISVVVATGNDGNTTAISSPACVQSAIPVGQTYDSNLGTKIWTIGNLTCTDATTFADKIVCQSNRNSIVQLFAPGSVINSASYTGGYTTKSGTSMATPHVSAAIAILNQYLKITSRTKTPAQIESILNSTGKKINDSATGLNFSRINLNDALLYLDSVVPDVNLMTPLNATNSYNNTQSFYCNASDWQLANLTFYIWNFTSIVNITTTNVSGIAGISSVNVTLIFGNYTWNCLAADMNGNIKFASSNNSLNILSRINVRLISPTDNIRTNQNQQFSCNASSDSNLSNVTFYLWNSTRNLINYSTQTIGGMQNSTSFTYNFSYEDNYNWNCLFANNLSIFAFAVSNFSIYYDNNAPLINIISPINGTMHNIGRFNVSIDENGTCMYSLDQGKNNVTMATTDNKNFSNTSSSLTAGNYNVTYYCKDVLNQTNYSNLVFFTIHTIVPIITLSSPADSSSYTGAQTLSFSFNASDTINITSCNLIIGNSIDQTNSSINLTNAAMLFTKTLSSTGTYAWGVNCSDAVGNIGSSVSRTLTINAVNSPTITSGGGGGSNSAIANVYIPSTKQIVEGYTKELVKEDKIKFAIIENGKEVQHTITLNTVNKDSVEVVIRSSPIILTLSIGEVAKVNITSSEHYDLSVKLESISEETAKITLKTIKETIPKSIPLAANSIQSLPDLTKEVNKTTTSEKLMDKIVSSKTRSKIYGILIITICTAALIFIFIKLFFHSKTDKDKNLENFGKSWLKQKN